MFTPNMMLRTFGALAVAMAFATATYAQGAGPIRGEIEKVDGNLLSVKTREGSVVAVKVADDVRLSALVKTTLAEIKKDAYVGIAGMARPDGSIEAFSIHVLPAAARGRGEGERPWDAKPGSTMTNAYLESSVEGSNGQALMVKYKDSEKKIIVTPSTVFAAAAPAEKSELKPGAHIIIFGYDKQPDGSVLAKTMYVGRGVTPAM